MSNISWKEYEDLDCKLTANAIYYDSKGEGKIHPEYYYLDTLLDVLRNGEEKPIFDSETGEVMPDKSLLSMFGKHLRFDLNDGFPVYTTKKVFVRGAFEEMLWFLKGDGNITELIQKNIHIWDDWGWKYYHDNQLYGFFPDVNTKEDLIRTLKETNQPFHIPLHYTNFTGYKYPTFHYDDSNNSWSEIHKLDQMNWVVENLPKRPERKSYYVTCWNPTEAYQMAEECDRESVVIVACHIDHILNVSRGKLCMRVGIRSNDMFLGNPFNVAQYAMLLHMYSFLTKFPVGELLINIDDCHIYYDHIDQCKEQIARCPRQLPKLHIRDRGQKRMQDFVFEDFTLEGYDPHPPIKGDLTVVGGY